MNEQPLYFLPHGKLQALIDALHQSGYNCVGPTIRQGAIVYDSLKLADELPWGFQDHQTPGQYKLEKTNEAKAFSFSNGPQAIKPILFKPRETLWKASCNEAGKIEFQSYHPEEAPIAFLGARACDLAAMAIQDKVFLQENHVDPHYRARRESLFMIAVNCSYASSNCFCVSAGTGPSVKNSYDILMTEIDQGFIAQSGSDRGQDILKQLDLSRSLDEQHQEALRNQQQAADMQTKRIPLDNGFGLRDLLFSNLEHPRWDEVAERCLSCGNCTQVCPTCFCHSEIEVPSLEGNHSEHQREWDSCFTAGHSSLSGKVIRDDTRKRYRQWLTHKVGSWFDQFDVSGCVGCGRCLSWCPVGIDITEELAAISGESNIREKQS